MRYWLAPALAILLLPACASRPTSPSGDGESGEGEGESNTQGDGADAGNTGSDSGGHEPHLPVNRDVDILFVIDNSGSMGEEQSNLAKNFSAFIDVLEDPEVNANYRIAVTTSDNGNPWCGTTSPEAGSLVYSSCLNRLADFTNVTGTVDASNIACADICSLDNGALAIGAGSDPWLENVEGVTNIPDGVTTAEAFRCIGPQGIAGCGFESQLESMNKALVRTDTQTDPAFGFVRENAILAIVHVTDEADCSYNNQWASIFEVDGNKVFWHPDSGNSPSSAICWNAGTACTDNGGGGYDCFAADYDVDGNLLDPAAPNTIGDAVLHPVSRYVDRVQGIENDKKELNPGQEVIVALIAGVGSDGQPTYADSPDPVFNKDFGIGAGCAAPVPGSVACTSDADCAGIGIQVCGPGGYCFEEQTAIPPVRLAAFTDAFTENNKFSICSDDYSPALQAIADAIADQLRPACFRDCVEDSDPSTPILDPECVVTERVGTTQTEVSECLRGTDGSYVLDPATQSYAMPDDATVVCFAYLVDTGDQSGSPLDDIDPVCTDDGYNLEFKIARRPGFPAAAGTSLSAECQLSDTPANDCPNL